MEKNYFEECNHVINAECFVIVKNNQRICVIYCLYEIFAKQ